MEVKAERRMSMGDKSSGLLGIVGAIVGIVAFLILQKVFPSIAAALLFLGGAVAVLVVLLVAVVMYFAFKKPKMTPEQIAQEEERNMIKEGRKELMTLRRMSMEVKHSGIRNLSTEICGVIEQIFRNLNENPSAVKSFDQFFRYYLPTIRKILEGYVKLEANIKPSEEVTSYVLTCLGDVKAAMEHKKENMFDDQILDLTVEMEVFTQICKRDGLLPDEKPVLKNGE